MNVKHSAAKLTTLLPPFLQALKTNDVPAVQSLINLGVDVDTTFYQGVDKKTALCICIESGTIDVAKFLIENGCSVNLVAGTGLSPLHLALMYRHSELVPLLIKHRANVNARDNILQTPLHVACMAGTYDTFSALVHANANVDALDLSHRSPLIYACATGKSDVAVSLLERDVNVNFSDFRGDTALVYAVSFKPSYDLVNSLIQHGAMVNSDDYNYTTAPILCFLKHLKENFPSDMAEGCRILQLLIDSGCKLNATAGGNVSVLHLAATNGNVEIMKLLLNAGCPNQADGIGRTPLYCACYYNYHEVVKLLIASGIDWAGERWLQNQALRSTCNEEIVLYCVEESRQFPRLCHLSRTVIRRFLAPDIVRSVDLLPCPPLIKEYIRLDHY